MSAGQQWQWHARHRRVGATPPSEVPQPGAPRVGAATPRGLQAKLPGRGHHRPLGVSMTHTALLDRRIALLDRRRERKAGLATGAGARSRAAAVADGRGLTNVEQFRARWAGAAVAAAASSAPGTGVGTTDRSSRGNRIAYEKEQYRLHVQQSQAQWAKEKHDCANTTTTTTTTTTNINTITDTDTNAVSPSVFVAAPTHYHQHVNRAESVGGVGAARGSEPLALRELEMRLQGSIAALAARVEAQGTHTAVNVHDNSVLMASTASYGPPSLMAPAAPAPLHGQAAVVPSMHGGTKAGRSDIVVSDHFARLFPAVCPIHTRRVMHPTSCLRAGVLDTDWCLQSDDMSNARLLTWALFRPPI